MGRARPKQVRGQGPRRSRWGGGCPAAHWTHGSHPQAACRKSKFPKYGLQPAQGITPRQGGGTPNPPSPNDPRTQEPPRWVPSAPALVTTGSASRVSHRKIPLQPSQRGWGADRGECPSEAPHLLEEGSPGEAGRGASARPCWAGLGSQGGWRALPRARSSGRGKGEEGGSPGPRRAAQGATGASCTQGGPLSPPGHELDEQSRPIPTATV